MKKRHHKLAEEMEDDPILSGLGVGGMTLSGLTGYDAARSYAREMEYEKLPALDWKDFEKMTQPGDVVFTSGPERDAFKRIIQAFGGTKYPHAELIADEVRKGRPTSYQAAGADDLAGLYRFRPEGAGRSPKNYAGLLFRPNVKKKEVSAALEAAEALEDRRYETVEELVDRLKKTISHAPSTSCAANPESGVVCTDIIAEAYPQLIKSRYTPAGEMMETLGKPIARLNTGRTFSPLEKFLAHVGGPALRNLKPAAIAGLGTAGILGALSLLEEEEQ